MSWPLLLVGAWRCTGRNNDEMVDKFAHMGIITTKEVEDAFRAVPRGAFVPPDLQIEAYVDSPIRGDPHVHMSAPHMYATVLEALQLSPGKLNAERFVSISVTLKFLSSTGPPPPKKKRFVASENIFIPLHAIIITCVGT